MIEDHRLQLRVATHESGHAVIAYHNRFQVMYLDTSALYGNGKGLFRENVLGAMNFLWSWPILDRPQPKAQIARNFVTASIAMAGQLAEELLLPEYDLSDRTVYEVDNATIDDSILHSVELDPTIDPTVLRQDIQFSTLAILSRNISCLKTLAMGLKYQPVLSGESLQMILKSVRRRRRRQFDMPQYRQ